MPRAFLTACLLLHLVASPATAQEKTVQGKADPLTEAKAAAEAIRRSGPRPKARTDWIFNHDAHPQFVWTDPDDFGSPAHPVDEIHWFDSEGARLDGLSKSAPRGRIVAVLRRRLPDGRTLERGITLFCRPEGWWLLFPKQLGVHLAPIEDEPGPFEAHGETAVKTMERILIESLNGTTEGGAELAAAWYESSRPGGEAPLKYGPAERAAHVKLQARLSMAGLLGKTKPLPPPRAGPPAPILEALSPPPGEGQMSRLEEICQGWADESDVPFVTFAASKGRILHHASYAPAGQAPPDLGFRSDVASLSKTAAGFLAARFLDAGLFQLDAPVSDVLPGFAEHPENTPTFRQCLRHEAGLSGHGSWGGVANPWFDHIVLNGIETLRPGEKVAYNGDSFDLVGSAMQLATGRTVTRLFHEGLLDPLGFEPIPIGQMGTGWIFSARELATLGQILLNRGRYGEREFFSEAVFEQMLPTPYDHIESPDPHRKQDFYGLGIRWVREHKTEDGQPILSARTLGHGSFFGAVFLVDLEKQIVVAQIRSKNHPSDATWLPRYLQAVAEM